MGNFFGDPSNRDSVHSSGIRFEEEPPSVSMANVMEDGKGETTGEIRKHTRICDAQTSIETPLSCCTEKGVALVFMTNTTNSSGSRDDDFDLHGVGWW